MLVLVTLHWSTHDVVFKVHTLLFYQVLNLVHLSCFFSTYRTEYRKYISIRTLLFILLLYYSLHHYCCTTEGFHDYCSDTPTSHNERYGRPK